MKEQILKLHKQGKSYRQICKELGCSISTVSYHCGEGQKEKSKKRKQENRSQDVISKKIYRFKKKKSSPKKKETKSNSTKLLRCKSDDFQRREKSKLGKRNIQFTYHDVLEKFGEQTICYLTGRQIDLNEPRTYNFDHIIPASKGGDNSIGNLGIVHKDANMAKGEMLLEEFLELCRDALEHNGYTVEK